MKPDAPQTRIFNIFQSLYDSNFCQNRNHDFKKAGIAARSGSYVLTACREWPG
jgi:hypothetical protein